MRDSIGSSEAVRLVHVLLFLILLLALGLRVSGLGWGLPDGTLPAHRSSNRGDENAILQDTLAVLQVLRGAGDLLTEHRFYMQEGWVGSYARLAFLGGAYLAGYIRFDDFANREIGGYDLLNFRRIFLVARSVSVLAAVATVWLIYVVGKSYWGQWQGLAAALLLAIFPGHVVLSHFAKSNALAALLATASLFFSLRWHRAPSSLSALLAGICAGLAGGARANALLSAVAFAIALILRGRTIRRAAMVSSIALAVAGIAAALAVSYPHLIANPHLPDYGVGNIWHLDFKWRAFGQDLWLVHGGWPGLVLLLVGVLLGTTSALRRGDGAYIIGLGWSAVYAIFIAKTAVPQPRYFVPVSPTLALIAGVGVVWRLERIRAEWLAWLGRAVTLGLVFLEFAFTAAYVSVLRAEDTKVSAGRWLRANALPGSLIGKVAWEGDHRVPVDSRVYGVVYSQPHPERPDLQVIGDNGSPRPDLIVMAEDQVGLNRFDMTGYGLVARIERPLAAFGLRLDDRFPVDDLGAPRWYAKFHATICIYQDHQRPTGGAPVEKGGGN